MDESAGGTERLNASPKEFRTQVAFYCSLWRLHLERLLPPSLSCCITVRDEQGVRAVLKLSPTHEDGRLEGRALSLWAGHGVPRLLQVDLHRGALLLERILPGRSPKSAKERSPERIGAALARLYARRAPCPAGFPSLSDRVRERAKWRSDYLAWTRQAPETDLLKRALEEADRLWASAHERVLIHGDFQVKNIVLRENGAAVVLDPLPCRGERAFDVALAAITTRSGLPVRSFVERMSNAVRCDPSRALQWTPIIGALIGSEHRTDLSPT